MTIPQTKMRGDFDSTYSMLDRKNRILRKELLSHMTESLEEVENRLSNGVKLAVQDYQLLEIEFRKNIKQDLFLVRDEIEKEKKKEEENIKELDRKFRMHESYLIELRQKFDDIILSNHSNSSINGMNLSSQQQLISYQTALESLGVKISGDILDIKREIENKNLDINSQILEMRKVVEQVIVTEEKSFKYVYIYIYTYIANIYIHIT